MASLAPHASRTPFSTPTQRAQRIPARCRSFIWCRMSFPELARSDQHPDRLLVENVAGFEVRRVSPAMLWLSELTTCHRIQPHVKFLFRRFALSDTTFSSSCSLPCNFGIPNSRLRYYLLAKTSSPPVLTRPFKFFGRRRPCMAPNSWWWSTLDGSPNRGWLRASSGLIKQLKDYLIRG